MKRSTQYTRFAAIAITAGALLAAAGCGDSSGPAASVPETELGFLRPALDAPALVQTQLAFWAVRGRGTEVRLEYVTGEDFLRFKLNDKSLLRRPDGTTIADGDSALITITVVDPLRLIVEFQPSGLAFDPREPAELELRYAHADHDLNDDGSVDSEDDRIESMFSIWRQERPGDPWFKVGSAVVKELDEVEARLDGFTRYAIAY